MIYIEFILNVVLATIALYEKKEFMPKRDELLTRWHSIPKGWRCIMVYGLAICPCIIGFVNGCMAKREHKADVLRITQLQESLDNANGSLAAAEEKLDIATNKIEIQERKLSDQSSIIIEQSRTIGSIAYNTRTTLEGKKRFIRCFRDLTRLTKLNPDGTVFEGLICDDGVAMYWFRRDNKQMTGFHFFPNSELNRVLAGLPTDSLLFAEDGSLNIDPQSELAIAFNESFFGQTPAAKGNAVEQERAIEYIIEDMELLLRYVYRAQSIQIQPSTTQDVVTRQKRFAGIAISFRYVVDPFSDTLVERALPFPKFLFSGAFLHSLCGISEVEFSQRVIEKWRSMGVEPKVRMRDIQTLNRIYEREDGRINSPFAKRGLEDK